MICGRLIILAVAGSVIPMVLYFVVRPRAQVRQPKVNTTTMGPA